MYHFYLQYPSLCKQLIHGMSNFIIFFSIMLLFFPVSGSKMDQPCHFPPQICIQSHSSVNLCPVFICRLIYAILRLLERSQMDPGFPHCFLVPTVSTCQYVLK